MSEMEVNKVDINTPKCGQLTVYTHASRSGNETAILTLHDLGCNHNLFLTFLQHPDMEQITKRFLWIHVDMPGQGNNEPDLPSDYKYPTLQEVADDLIHVIDHLGVKNVVLFGEGAGANVLARFAIGHDERVLGCFLVQIVGNSDSFITKTTRRRSISSKQDSHVMTAAAEEYLVKHHFGPVKDTSHRELRDGVEAFKASINSSINTKNLNQYIFAYLNRNSLKEKIGDLKCPCLFVTATLASHNHEAVELHYALQKALDGEPTRRAKVELVQIAGATNAIVEKADKVAESFQFFLQGLGLGGAITSRKMSTATPAAPVINRKTSRSMSMEEYDQPRGKDYYKQQSGVENTS